MPDYSTEIAALIKAMATGVRTVTHGDTTTQYASFEDMLKALNFLQTQTASATRGPLAGFASFSAGGACTRNDEFDT